MARKSWFGASLLVLVLVAAVVFIAVSKKSNDAVSEDIKKTRETNENKQTEETAEKIIMESKKVKLQTNMGGIIIELNEKKAPITVKNFLQYIKNGFYDSTIFHRIIPNFMIQGGGFTKDMVRKQTSQPIKNEASNGLKNNRGTIAMARTNNPNSATSQFFINHKNNDSLNYAGPSNPGYTVFGKVVEGMDVVNEIAAVKTAVRNGMRDVPVKPVVIKSAKVISQKEESTE